MSHVGESVKRAGERVERVCDRFWLFTIAAIALGIIGAIVFVIWQAGSDGLGPEELAVLGSLSTGLLMIVQKVIEAQQQRRMADQLASSSPPGPIEARITNSEADAVPVEPQQ